MTERNYNSFERESVKQRFQQKFGDMLEEDEVRRILGKTSDLNRLLEEKELIAVWPGGNKPIYPYFQFRKGRLRPQIKTVLNTIYASSNGSFFSPLMFCEWMYRPIEGTKNTRPLDLMKQDKDKKLIAQAQEYGETLLPKRFYT